MNEQFLASNMNIYSWHCPKKDPRQRGNDMKRFLEREVKREDIHRSRLQKSNRDCFENPLPRSLTKEMSGESLWGDLSRCTIQLLKPFLFITSLMKPAIIKYKDLHTKILYYESEIFLSLLSYLKNLESLPPLHNCSIYPQVPDRKERGQEQ